MAASRPPIWARFWRDRCGVVAVAVAVLLPVLIGFAGIGIEVGLWFAIQRQNQSAADAAAISAGLEYAAQIQSNVATDPAGAATTAAGYNLFNNANCSTSGMTNCTLFLCYGFTVGGSCNTSNPNGAQLNAVQVGLTQPLNTAFANIVTAIWGPNINTVKVTTTAIAYFPAAGTACLLARDSISANVAFVNNGTPNSNCWVAANSSSASALNCNNCTIAGPTTVVGGDTLSNGGQLNGSPNRTYASAIADPYAATLTHAFLTARMPARQCAPQPGPPGTQNYNSNCVNNGDLTFGPGITNLSPGPYWITDGNLQVSGTLTCRLCSPNGPGVTIIFTTTQGAKIGTLLLSGNPTITLNAPGPGINNAGLLMLQDTVAGVQPAPAGQIVSPSATLSGLLYFPSTTLNFLGTVQTDPSNCLVVVANRLLVTGSISLDVSGCPAAGLATVPTILSVFLAV